MSTSKKSAKPASNSKTKVSSEAASKAVSAKKSQKIEAPTETKGSGKKASIHPNYRVVTVELTDGTLVKVRSTVSKDAIKLDIDPKTHPAWTKRKGEINTNAGEVAKFQSKFGGVSLASLMGKKTTD